MLEELQYIAYVDEYANYLLATANAKSKDHDAAEYEHLKNQYWQLKQSVEDLKRKFEKAGGRIALLNDERSASKIKGSCWNCGATGHGWRFCDKRKPTDPTNLPYRLLTPLHA